SEGREGVAKEVLFASESGGVLSNGIYWLVITVNTERYKDIYQYPLAVATANLAVKRAPNETLIWVTDMSSGEPVQETSVTVYHNNQAVARGQTDSDGVFRAPVQVPNNDQFVVIEAN